MRSFIMIVVYLPMLDNLKGWIINVQIVEGLLYKEQRGISIDLPQ